MQKSSPLFYPKKGTTMKKMTLISLSLLYYAQGFCPPDAEPIIEHTAAQKELKAAACPTTPNTQNIEDEEITLYPLCTIL